MLISKSVLFKQTCLAQSRWKAYISDLNRIFVAQEGQKIMSTLVNQIEFEDYLLMKMTLVHVSRVHF